MKIGIIGTGHVGGALGGRWARSGHEIIFGSRDPQGEKAQNLLRLVSGNVRVTGTTEAVSAAEVVLLATPWSATRDTLDRAGSTNLAGKVVIDAVNPIGPDRLLVGGNTSAAERIASWAPGARLVKAFNSTGSGNMSNTDYGGEKPSLFLCGDDAEAKNVVARLGAELDFDPVDCGPLSMARYLEPLAMLWINLSYNQGFGPDIAFRLLKR
jgi:8-hydroxy-5-deazaflavin:NADPH oxidoreductase